MDLRPVGYAGEQPIIGLRQSVVAMEVSQRRRRCAIWTYLIVVFILSFISSVKVLQWLDAIPSTPGYGDLSDAVDNYTEFCNETNIALYNEIYTVYIESLESQGTECNSTLDGLYAEEDRIKANATFFSANYCDDLVSRIWTQMEAYKYYNTTIESSYVDCPTNTNFNSMLSNYIPWLVNSSLCPATVYTDANGVEYCYFAIFLQKNPNLSGCSTDFEFDAWTDLYTELDNSNTCYNLRVTSLEPKVTYTEQNYDIGFTESVDARMNYDYDYFVGVSGSMGTSFDISASVQSSPSGIEIALQEYAAQLKANALYMKTIYNAWDSYYQYGQYLPDELSGTSFATPNVAIPSVPTEYLDSMSADLDNFISTSDFLQNYNPPQVVPLSTEISLGVTPINTTYEPPVVSFASFEILAALISSWAEIIKILASFTSFDLIFRLMQFLQDAAIVLMEPRRDMSTATNKAKQRLSVLFSNSTAFVYAILLCWGIAAVYMYALDDTSVYDELYTECNNQVLVQNGDKLTEYQNEVAQERNECDTVIASENDKCSDLNVLFGSDIRGYVSEFENLYQSVNPVKWLVINSVNVTFKNFSLPSTSLIVDITLGEYQTITPIETYVIDTGLCTNSSSAQEVADAFVAAYNDFKVYMLRVFLACMFSLIGTRLVSYGFRLYFWMEICRGYFFDAEFTSANVKEKIAGKKKMAYFIWICAILMYAALAITAQMDF